MISAPPVGIEYVSGSSRLIVDNGPMPGSSPTSVPTAQPMAQYIRLCSVSAWLKPNARLCRTSIRCPSDVPSDERQVEAEQGRERKRDGHQHDADHQVA